MVGSKKAHSSHRTQDAGGRPRTSARVPDFETGNALLLFAQTKQMRARNRVVISVRQEGTKICVHDGVGRSAAAHADDGVSRGRGQRRQSEWGPTNYRSALITMPTMLRVLNAS